MSEPNPQYQNQQYNQSPFRLFEGMLPTGAKNLVRGTYGVIGVAALALGICLLVWPGITLKVAAIVLGIYFLISGVVRIVSSLVEMGLPAGWRILGVLIGIILVIGGIVIFKNVTMSTAMLAIMFTLIVGICWIMEGVMALAESWSVPSSGWAIAYAIISIIAGGVHAVADHLRRLRHGGHGHLRDCACLHLRPREEEQLKLLMNICETRCHMRRVSHICANMRGVSHYNVRRAD